MAPDENSLQRLLDVVRTWCSIWRMDINVDKTRNVHLRPNAVNSSSYVFKEGSKIVDYTHAYKYLGLGFTRN